MGRVMPIEGLEWMFISMIVIILLLWDPQKIPKLARALAEAKKEYEKATATVQEMVEEVQSEVAEEPKEEEDLDERIIKTAKELGIETYGKTKDEIVRAILAKKIESKTSDEQPAGSSEDQPSKNIP